MTSEREPSLGEILIDKAKWFQGDDPEELGHPLSRLDKPVPDDTPNWLMVPDEHRHLIYWDAERRHFYLKLKPSVLFAVAQDPRFHAALKRYRHGASLHCNTKRQEAG